MMCTSFTSFIVIGGTKTGETASKSPEVWSAEKQSDDGKASEKTRKGGFSVSCLGAYGDAAFTKGGKAEMRFKGLGFRR